MANNKRKRAVVLALIAFFCGATAVVSVDWKRFGGGFLAFFKSKSDPVLASAGSGGVPPGGAILTALADVHPTAGPQLKVNAPPLHRHASGVGGGAAVHPSDDDLFKYGDPAAGGMPAGSFVVAQNDAPAAGPAPLIEAAAATETAVGEPSGGQAPGGVTSPAPAPNIGFGGGGGIVVTSPPPPSSGTPPAPPPATSTPSAPTPPTQSGTSDNGNGNGDGSGDGDPTPPILTSPTPPSSPVPPPVPPVASVPEASNAAMMGLGALFLAVAATRRRKNDRA